MEVYTYNQHSQPGLKKTVRSDAKCYSKPKSASYPNMVDISHRMNSFSSWPDTGLKNVRVLIQAMVAYGLFFSSTDNQLICYACGARITSCGDEPVSFNDKHKKLSPNCVHLTSGDSGKCHGSSTDDESGSPESTLYEEHDDDLVRSDLLQSAGNNSCETFIINDKASATALIKGKLPVGADSTILEKRTANRPQNVQVPDYTVESNRLDSFRGVWSEAYPVRPRDLAMAGLYFTGPNDRVQCAYCKGGLLMWQEGDSALVEHRRHFPECVFMKTSFDQIMHRYLESGTAVNTSSQGDLDGITKCKGIVRNLGYSMDDIETAVNQLQQEGSEITTSSVLDSLFDAPISTSEEPTRTPTDTYTSEGGATRSSSSASPMTISQPGSSSSSETIMVLKQENRSLSERVTCKVCLSDSVQDVFMPCRHLVCCGKCSEAVSACPVCRTPIAAIIKAFMA